MIDERTKESDGSPIELEVIQANDKPKPQKFINVNALMSAGPRKTENQDTELGEDVIGYMTKKEGTAFWVLDGTSDSTIIVRDDKSPLISSRMLAQLLGNQFWNLFYDKDLHLVDLTKDFVACVDKTKDIMERILNFVDEDKKKLITDKSVHISTTVLVGKFLSTGETEILLLGDCKIKLYKMIDPKYDLINDLEGEGRLHFTLDYKEDGFKILTNAYENKLKSDSFTDIDLILAYTDGIKQSENALRFFPIKALEHISTNIQRSFDDKSLLCLERK